MAVTAVRPDDDGATPSTPTRSRPEARHRVPGPALLLVVVALAVAGLTALARAGGDRSFPTHPAGVAALLAVGLALALAPRATALVRAAGASLLTYALLGVTAVTASEAGGPTTSSLASVLVSLWGAAWVPPLVTTSAAALAVTGSPGDHRQRWVAALLGVGAVVTLATAALQLPVAPFSGVPPAAPSAWAVRGGPVLDAVGAVGQVALLAVVVALGVAAVRAPGTAARARAVLLLVGGAAPVAVVVVCLLLAVARDPGGVDPSTGSTGFLVVLATGCAAGCAAVTTAAITADGTDPHRPALVAARCAAGAVVAVSVLGGGVVLASLLDQAPLLLVVGAVGLLAAAGVECWRRASGWAAALVTERSDTGEGGHRSEDDGAAPVVRTTPEAAVVVQPPPPRTLPPRGWDELTRREREVLAVLATGASNAGIAERLGISPRTVEAHLRSVFVRLGLDAADGANRRVVAARLWLAHAEAG